MMLQIWLSLVSEKNIALFEKMNVMDKEECEARAIVLHDHYAGTVEIWGWVSD